MADFNNILPSGVDIKAIEIVSNQPTVRTTSVSGRQQVRSFGGQYWTMKITMPLMNEFNLRQIYGFLIKQKGGLSTFTIAPKNLKDAGSSTVTNTASEGIDAVAVGATSVELDNQNKMFAGDMFKFSGHTKAYMVTADQGSDDTVNFEPACISAVGASETLQCGTNFFMTVRLTGDNFSYQMDENGLGSIEFDVVEVV